MRKKIFKIFNKIENLIFKNHACLVCRKEIPDGTQFSLCKHCFDKLKFFGQNTCAICGDVCESKEKTCKQCEKTKFNFDKNISLVVYDETASRLIKRFKYNGKRYYAKHLAELMMTKKLKFDKIDYIAFVPIGIKRRKERGFNQAEEIARELGKLSNIPVIEVLQKVGNEKHQAGLSQAQRQQNLSGSFMINESYDFNLKNKNLLLIDDVFTTGATLSECCKAIKSNQNNRPNKIYCYTFAKTKLNSTNNG